MIQIVGFGSLWLAILVGLAFISVWVAIGFAVAVVVSIVADKIPNIISIPLAVVTASLWLTVFVSVIDWIIK